MSRKIQKQNLPLRLEAQLWSGLRFQPGTIVGAGNAVKGLDERQKRAPLTAFPAQCPRALFLHLTPTVVVIDGMTNEIRGKGVQRRSFFLAAANSESVSTPR